jgi:DNA-binding winged helix-turn-helix (wHTH) protein/tetratricopeptide (TPR) repeat protein
MNRPASLRSIMDSVVDRRPFSVGGATVDPVSRDASWPGGEERLQPQTLKVLLILVSHRGDVVTRDDLIQLCWDGRIVGDDVINRSISLLRHFAERAGGFEIETVPRTGYRLVETQSRAKKRPMSRWTATAAVLIVGIVTVAGWAWLDDRPARQGVPPILSATVAPFAASNDALARQVAQAAPISLEHMMSESGFAVVRADHAGEQPPGSNYVFSGNVRRSATSVEVTVQMVSKRDGTIAFAHDFSAPIDRAADLPDRIGATAAAELAWTGAEMVLDPSEHLSPEIASELMRSMNLTIEEGDSLRAYQLARQAAALAPDSAMAQLTLEVQTSFSISSIPRDERGEAVAIGRRASEHARALAPEFGDVYLTWCLLHSPVRMIECDVRGRRALEVDSRSSFVPGYLSSLFEDAGRIDESLQFARQSLANDPYKPAKLARMIRLLEASGNSDQAERIYEEGRRLWPDSGRMRRSRLLGMAELGNYAGLAAFADPVADAPMLDPAPFRALTAAQRTHDLPGAQRACDSKIIKPFMLTLCMAVLADLGDLDRSFAIAAVLYPAWHAARGTDEDRLWLDNPGGFQTDPLTGPAARSMRSDSRFLDLAQKVGLLAYWRSTRLPDFCTKAHEPVCARITRKPI